MQTVNITALVKSPRSLWFLFAFLLTSLICETAKGVAPIAPTRTVELHVSGNDLVQVLSVPDVNTTLTLVADTAVTPTATELVTFGVPFAEGEVLNANEIRVSIAGSEVAAYVEPKLLYHWSDNSIRSATIQLQNVDMTGGDVTVTVTDDGASVARLTEQPHSNGWATAGADKDNLPYPRIFALHDTAYLASSGVVPPYSAAPSTPDDYSTFTSTQFDTWAGSMDYTASSRAPWLFDRPSAMFKAYMHTGEVKYLKEGFLAKQFYYSKVRNDGSQPSTSGGDGCFEWGGSSCADAKYIYAQPAKLSLALTGDDSQFDNALIDTTVATANAGNWQPNSLDSYDSQTEVFTERGIGLLGLLELHAYEITGNSSHLTNVNRRIAYLKDMQQTEKSWDTANGWTPKSGAFTHNVYAHEGGTVVADDANQRGFSTWMLDQVVDFLWHAYQITGNSDIPEMLRQAGNALELYGFQSYYDSGTFTKKTAFAGYTGGLDKLNGCNQDRVAHSPTYFGSAYADDTARQNSVYWGDNVDSHTGDLFLPMALAYLFETDTATKTRLKARLDAIDAAWFATCGGFFGQTQRMWNWSHRSNGYRTWKWVEAQ